MTVPTATVYIQNPTLTSTAYIQDHTLTNNQSNKHTLIVVKCLQLSTNNIRSATEIGCRCKEQDTTTGLSESNINYSIDLVRIARTEST